MIFWSKFVNGMERLENYKEYSLINPCQFLVDDRIGRIRECLLDIIRLNNHVNTPVGVTSCGNWTLPRRMLVICISTYLEAFCLSTCRTSPSIILLWAISKQFFSALNLWNQLLWQNVQCVGLRVKRSVRRGPTRMHVSILHQWQTYENDSQCALNPKP